MKKTIAILAFEGISPFHLSVPAIVFGDRDFLGTCYELMVCAETPGKVCTSAGFSMLIEHGLEALDRADIIIVPSWHEDVAITPSDQLIAALNLACQQGRQLVGLCLGAYVLAASGLLSGKTATTHWAFAQDFAQRFPDVRLEPDVLYVREGNCTTSAGTVAGLDCCLSLVREWHGAEIANQIARTLVIPPHRQGGQAQFVSQPIPQSASSSRLDELMDHVRANLHQPIRIDEVAERAHMSRRTFTRQFRLRTGRSFGDWLLSERLFYAQRLLETTSLAMDRVAGQSGFASPVTFRYHFVRQFGLTPAAWRKSFAS